jgi:alpha-L-fucosidase
LRKRTRTLSINGLLDSEISGIELLGSQEPVRWQRSAEALTIQLPRTLPGELVNCFKIKVR